MSWRKGDIDRKRWGRVRLQVLDRDNWRCQKCRKPGARFEVDHIIPLHKGGAKYALSNLQTLCRSPCHFDKTAKENIAANETPEQARWRALIEERLADL